MTRTTTLNLILAATLFTTTSLAAPPTVKPSLKFDGTSDYALIVFESEPQNVVSDWRPEFFSFAPESRRWTYGPLKGWSVFKPIDNPPGDRFHAALVKPAGIYAINNISVQTYWKACLNGGTAAFRLEAGKVNYIGLIDPQPNFAEIRAHLPMEISGMGGLPHQILFDIPRLHLTPPSAVPQWTAALTDFLAAALPKVTAPIVAAEPIDVTFEPGRVVGKQICEKY
jgi:hypothetical protein